MMSKRLSVLAVATALSGAALLSGCGGSSGSDTSASSAAPAEASSAPAADASSSTGAGSESADASSGADAASKPAEKDVAAGLKKLVSLDQQETSAASKTTDKLFACMAHKAYSAVSADGLQRIAEGTVPTDAADLQAFQKATGDPECQKQAVSG